MGSKPFNFLTESFLFDGSLIRDQFRSIPDSEMITELRNYKEFCIANRGDIATEIQRDRSNLKYLLER